MQHINKAITQIKYVYARKYKCNAINIAQTHTSNEIILSLIPVKGTSSSKVRYTGQTVFTAVEWIPVQLSEAHAIERDLNHVSHGH